MAVSVSGTATYSKDVSPIHDHTTLTTIMGKSPEQLKISELKYLIESCKRAGAGGDDPNRLVSTQLAAYV